LANSNAFRSKDSVVISTICRYRVFYEDIWYIFQLYVLALVEICCGYSLVTEWVKLEHLSIYIKITEWARIVDVGKIVQGENLFVGLYLHKMGWPLTRTNESLMLVKDHAELYHWRKGEKLTASQFWSRSYFLQSSQYTYVVLKTVVEKNVDLYLIWRYEYSSELFDSGWATTTWTFMHIEIYFAGKISLMRIWRLPECSR